MPPLCSRSGWLSEAPPRAPRNGNTRGSAKAQKSPQCSPPRGLRQGTAGEVARRVSGKDAHGKAANGHAEARYSPQEYQSAPARLRLAKRPIRAYFRGDRIFPRKTRKSAGDARRKAGSLAREPPSEATERERRSRARGASRSGAEGAEATEEDSTGKGRAILSGLTSGELERGEPSLTGFRGFGGRAPVVSPERSEGGDSTSYSFFANSAQIQP